MHEPSPSGHDAQESRPILSRLRARDRHEPHRVSTPLELLFDLCFVVAIAQVAGRLHHGIAGDHLLLVLRGYLMVFFAIWWAWMNFTWYASAYDNDDVVYRLTTLVVMAGALVLAAGVPRAFDEGDFKIPTIGYAIMRVGLVPTTSTGTPRCATRSAWWSCRSAGCRSCSCPPTRCGLGS
jgi:low temperature requirement protein LtrA